MNHPHMEMWFINRKCS